MFVTIVLACLVVCLVFNVIKGKPRNFPPGPICLPIVGCLAFVPSKYLHLRMEKWLKQYGPVVGLMIGSQPAVAICGPTEVLEILRREEFQGRPENANFRQENFNRKLGLFFSDGPFWIEQRRFTLHHLRDLGFGRNIMVASIFEEIEDVIKELRQREEFQVSGFFGPSTVNVIWALVSGARYSRDDDRLRALLHILTRLFRTGSQIGGIVNAVPALQKIAPQISGYRENLEHITNLKAFLKKVVREHDETFKENDLRDFIDVYLKEMKYQSGNENSTFSEDGLIITCFDLFAAGAESVSNTISFSLLYTVLYPEVQRKVQSMLDDVVGRERRPRLDDRPRLQYVEAVLNEVMRINTVAPIAPAHRVTHDSTLNGYNIPKDTTVIASLWCLMHDKEHWGDPEAFRPERFLDEYGNFAKDEWMLPFGTGKRTCLGEVMVRSCLFIFYTALLQEFSFSLPAGDPRPSTSCLPGITTAPQQFRVKISRRY